MSGSLLDGGRWVVYVNGQLVAVRWLKSAAESVAAMWREPYNSVEVEFRA